jgi:Zn-dependent M28 family amino/carboxypeptidase
MNVKKFFYVILALFLSFASCKVRNQSTADLRYWEIETVRHATVTDITEDDIRWHISVLASDSMYGRRAGTAHDTLAAEYIGNKFKSLGLEAFNKNCFQSFPVNIAHTSSQNVVAYLKSKDSGNKNEYIVIGAHYDHLGTRTVGDSLLIFNGADDNASGVAGLLELAEKMCSEKTLKYNVLFVAFGAEEFGLIGSRFFCDNPPVPIKNIKLMVNMDMIGRMDSVNRLFINTVEHNAGINAIIDKLKDAHPEVDAVISLNQRNNTDHFPLYDKPIPVISFTTELHDAYHTPADTIGAINFQGQKRLLDFIYDLVTYPAIGDNTHLHSNLDRQN